MGPGLVCCCHFWCADMSHSSSAAEKGSCQSRTASGDLGEDVVDLCGETKGERETGREGHHVDTD